MHRAAALTFLVVLLSARLPAQAPATPQAPAAAPTAPVPQPVERTFVEREDARVTRQRLHEMLRQHPPAVGEILRRDPTLARADYLASYPALVAFLQQHPEVVRNPSFFFGGFEYVESQPRDRAFEMFRRVTDGIGFLIIFGAILGSFIWLVRSIVEQRRWLRVSRTQADVHTKLLDRLTNNEDLLAYIQTPAGRRFLEAGPLMTEAEPSRPVAAASLSRIVVALQAGIVLASLGIGFWISQSRFPDDMGEGFFVIGTLATALGVGFAVSAWFAYLISLRFGLVAPPAPSTHE